jgi:2-hydroxy-3-keto-5-methylthiopentenyl-1-phosphate phosphatase
VKRLLDGVERLSAKATAQVEGTARQPISLEAIRNRVQESKPTKRTKLADWPSAFDDSLSIFTEFDQLCLSGRVDDVLLGEEAAAAGADDKAVRLAALCRLDVPLDEAVSKLDQSGVRLREEFVDFAEMCAARRIRLLVLSRGLKPLIRQVLRDQGLGHVEVLAHDAFVEPESGKWRVSYRDESATGHDKAESMRRALQSHGTKKPAGAAPSVLLVGQYACDFAPVSAGSVDCLLAPAGSELAQRAAAEGIAHRTFNGWPEVLQQLLQ